MIISSTDDYSDLCQNRGIIPFKSWGGDYSENCSGTIRQTQATAGVAAWRMVTENQRSDGAVENSYTAPIFLPDFRSSRRKFCENYWKSNTPCHHSKLVTSFPILWKVFVKIPFILIQITLRLLQHCAAQKVFVNPHSFQYELHWDFSRVVRPRKSL